MNIFKLLIVAVLCTTSCNASSHNVTTTEAVTTTAGVTTTEGNVTTTEAVTTTAGVNTTEGNVTTTTAGVTTTAAVVVGAECSSAVICDVDKEVDTTKHCAADPCVTADDKAACCKLTAKARAAATEAALKTMATDLKAALDTLKNSADTVAAVTQQGSATVAAGSTATSFKVDYSAAIIAAYKAQVTDASTVLMTNVTMAGGGRARQLTMAARRLSAPTASFVIAAVVLKAKAAAAAAAMGDTGGIAAAIETEVAKDPMLPAITPNLQAPKNVTAADMLVKANAEEAVLNEEVNVAKAETQRLSVLSGAAKTDASFLVSLAVVAVVAQC